jgi:hypothetical protein
VGVACAALSGLGMGFFIASVTMPDILSETAAH